MPDILLLVAAKLSWRAAGGGKDLGEMVGPDGSIHTLTLCQEQGIVSWALVERLPRGFIPIPLTALAGEALRRGSALSLRFDGAALYAEASDAHPAA
jgi:hypothetical protein